MMMSHGYDGKDVRTKRIWVNSYLHQCSQCRYRSAYNIVNVKIVFIDKKVKKNWYGFM